MSLWCVERTPCKGYLEVLPFARSVPMGTLFGLQRMPAIASSDKIHRVSYVMIQRVVVRLNEDHRVVRLGGLTNSGNFLR